MSTNDDSASRRGRRADQGEPDWRAPRQHPGERWDQPPSANRDTENSYPADRGREGSSQHAAYSGFTRPSYSQQSHSQPRKEQAPPPQPRAFEPPQAPQGYHQEPQQRQDMPRSYSEPAAAYSPPPQSYEPVPQHSPYGDAGYSDAGRDDLFTREQAPLGYDRNPYAAQPGYQPEPYPPPPARAPLVQPAAPRHEEPDYYQRDALPPEEYERGFAARIATQEGGASRFFLPEEQPQAPQRPLAQPERSGLPSPQQSPMDRGYAPSQPYASGGYDPRPVAQASYEHDRFDPRFAATESWPAEEQGFHPDDERGGLPQAVHGDELDEDFFADEDEFEQDEHYYAPQKRGRKKLVFALLAGTAVLAAGGAYVYKAKFGGGGDKATPFIHADNRPSKEAPENPGGRQYPNGEKAIYERLTPDGHTQVASFVAPAVAPALPAPAFASAPSPGNSLEDRIDEALKKAQRTGDAPASAPASTGRAGPDQPTVVRSESYRPDGTRVDTRPVINPTISPVDNGLPCPFGPNCSPAASPQSPAPYRPASAQPPAQPAFSAPATAAKSAPARMAARTPPPAEAAPAPAAAGGYFVSLKSSPDEKAIQTDIPKLTDKYKSALGDVQISSKIADLGAKGVTYRAVAGPLGTQAEAQELCQKIKGVGGDKACFVTK